jgi:hypothetical protein
MLPESLPRSRRSRCPSASGIRTLGVPTLAYLTWAFERLGTHRDLYGLGAADVTPAAFKRRA